MSLATRKNIRVTADTLFKDFFTEDIKIFNKESFLYAAFFLDENGKAVHVSGWNLGMFMNISRQEPGQRGNWRTEAASCRKTISEGKQRIRDALVSARRRADSTAGDDS